MIGENSMSMTATEARELTDSINMKNLNAKIKDYDELITETANAGDRVINTSILTKKMQTGITEYYENLGYDVAILGNNMVTIGW
jgi:excinuclease UvrABC helicase subunit UvrB